MHEIKKIQLFCLPFAGGSAYAYRELQKHLPAWIVLEPVELPGRGPRFTEPLLHNIPALTRDALRTIEKKVTGPYAIFGHSMGGSIGYQVCKALCTSTTMAAPLRLFVSAKAAPSIPITFEDWHTLPTAIFWKKLESLGGVPSAILENEELKQLVEPILRADFEAEAGNKYEGPGRLTLPVTTFLGKDDDISQEDMMAWQHETLREMALHTFEGGHFYLFDVLDQVGKIIGADLERDINA